MADTDPLCVLSMHCRVVSDAALIDASHQIYCACAAAANSHAASPATLNDPAVKIGQSRTTPTSASTSRVCDGVGARTIDSSWLRAPQEITNCRFSLEAAV